MPRVKAPAAGKTTHLDVGAAPVPGHHLVRPLGRGGFGEVWEANDPAGKPVALKFLRCTNTGHASEENRSLQIVRQLRHPNLMTVDNVWSCPGYLVVSMALADGTLLDLYEAYQAEFGTPVLPEHLLPFLEQAAVVLDFLNTRQHKIGGQCVAVQHCDVKPSNLLLFGDTVKLSDFSLTSVTTSVMKAHRMAGSLDYTAPEVFQGRLSDRTDQYALAVTYCQLRGGRPPFPAPPRPVPRTYARPEPDLAMLPESERPLLERALAPAPADRYPSCGEFVAALKRRTQRDSRKVRNLRAHFQQAAAQPPGEERRAHVRYQCSLKTSYRYLGGPVDRSCQAVIQDISQGGIAIASSVSFQPGTALMVKLNEPALRALPPLLVRVVHASRPAGGDWLLGCALASKLSEEVLQNLMRATSPPPPAEHAAPRERALPVH